MSSRLLRLAGGGVMACALAGLATAPVAGQSAKAGTTPWGHPDLQGIWASNSATPMERPKVLEGRDRLTDQELAVLRQRAAELFDGETDAAFGDQVFETVLAGAKNFKSSDAGTGNYNHFWLVDRWFDNRTSLIIEPKSGRLPALTAAGQKRAAERAAWRKEHPADGPEDRSVSERCMTGQVPMFGRGYNSNFQIVQTPTHVVINMEMMHDARVISLDGRPHIPNQIRGFMGDARGRWEGKTLVVDTTNLRGGGREAGGPSSHLIERFTRVDAETLHYQVTVNDPETYTAPWTALVIMKPTGGTIYEYACHERNDGLAGILRGHRAQERDAAQKTTSGAGR